MKHTIRKIMPIVFALLALTLAMACERPDPEPELPPSSDTVPAAPVPTNADLILGRWHQDLLNGHPVNAATGDLEWDFHADNTMTHYAIDPGDTIILYTTYTITEDSLFIQYESGPSHWRLDELTDSLLIVYIVLGGEYGLVQFHKM
ncbi:MAG: hypothetical protein J6X79_07040 [Bacteroidales bacterium]|nr:hypothetical protein [Bacteroidales bacterium]